MNKTLPMLMIFVTQVVQQIAYILRKIMENGMKIVSIGKREIGIICSLFLDEKMDSFKLKLFHFFVLTDLIIKYSLVLPALFLFL